MKFSVLNAVSMMFAVSLLTANSCQADDQAISLQSKRLNSPSKTQSNLEKDGKVYLYIGLKDKEVDRALDTQFDRIENFMFLSVIKTDNNEKSLRTKTGELLLESDDC